MLDLGIDPAALLADCQSVLAARFECRLIAGLCSRLLRAWQLWPLLKECHVMPTAPPAACPADSPCSLQA